MLNEQKLAQLAMAKEFCDETDKSTEFMIEFMKDMAGCSHEEVMWFISCCCGTEIK